MNEQSSKKVLSEVYYSQVNESIRDLFELSTRIDERVQGLIKKQDEFDKKTDQINTILQRIALIEQKGVNDNIQGFKDKVEDLERDVADLEKTSDRSGERVKQVVSFVVQLVWVVVASYILWKLHLQAPATP